MISEPNPKIVEKHPVLSSNYKEKISFFYNGKKYIGYKGMMITSALASYGIYNIGKNIHDHSDQGLFCANGMCAQCRVIADGYIVKGCMTPIEEGMNIFSLSSLPELKKEKIKNFPDIYEMEVDVVIIGGGPSGLAAASILKDYPDLKVLLVDDKPKLGGKLLLQTHKFFGSKEDCYAGTRGLDIAKILENSIVYSNNIKIFTDTYFIGGFEDSKVGLFNGKNYYIVKTKSAILATGAREKYLTFKNNHLPGIFGAGAFQTLLNRDLVVGFDKIFIVGAGNVGLIAAYHALQAGIKVVGICDVAPKQSGYKVHLDKIKRLGVPVFFNHTVLEAEGVERVSSVKIAKVNEDFSPDYNTIKEFSIDTLLIAVGLAENNEFEDSLKSCGIKLFKAGDANEIAEASSAMFSGKLAAMKLLQEIGININFPESILEKEKILKMPGGKVYEPEEVSRKQDLSGNVYPRIFCYQQIPCNPCVTSCTKNCIKIDGNPIYDIPIYTSGCIGCNQCVITCPALAITLVDKRKRNGNKVIVTLPFEFLDQFLPEKDYDLTDFEGNVIGKGEFRNIKNYPKEKRSLVSLWVDEEIADKVASFQLPLQKDIIEKKYVKENGIISDKENMNDNKFVCICERVTADEVRNIINLGIKDINFIKAATRLSMGACGGKTCSTTITSLFREAQINRSQIETNKPRPLIVEVPFKYFAGKIVKIPFKKE
ncbi:MAG: FAD-dependent oxidoreductase [Spirochaetales bacterium]|nr:FAD-dependent oxidoreductase [Spirochaetales bacterium]